MNRLTNYSPVAASAVAPARRDFQPVRGEARVQASHSAGFEPPLTAKERVGFGVCMAVCALVGAMLAIGGVL